MNFQEDPDEPRPPSRPPWPELRSAAQVQSGLALLAVERFEHIEALESTVHFQSERARNKHLEQELAAAREQVRVLRDRLTAIEPVMTIREATCCSWDIGAHYGRDMDWRTSDLVPAHEPKVREVGQLLRRSDVLALLADTEGAARPDEEAVVRRWLERLRPFISHVPDCASYIAYPPRGCSCGLADALAALLTEPTSQLADEEDVVRRFLLSEATAKRAEDWLIRWTRMGAFGIESRDWPRLVAALLGTEPGERP